jgi:hypothetical protein
MSDELESWKRACLALVIVSLIIFAIQRSSYRFLDPVFETTIFHLPTIVSIMIYFYLARRESPSVEQEKF